MSRVHAIGTVLEDESRAEDLKILQYDAPPREALMVLVPHILLQLLFRMWETPMTVPIVNR